MLSLLLTACGGSDSTSLPSATSYAFETIDSMTLANDAVLLNASENASWAKTGHITQGIPRGDAGPVWWADDVVDETIKTSEPWNALTGWFTVFESQNNTDQNAKIYYSDFEVWLLKGSDVKSAVWEQLPAMPTSWAAYYDTDIVTGLGSALPDSTSGYYEFQHPNILHGGTSKVSFDGHDVLGVFVRTKAWLDSADSQAELLISVGADYYPTYDSSVSKGDFANANYLPGAGSSRFVYLTTKPTWYYMANIADDTLSNVDKQSPYMKNGGKSYLTADEWLDNYPDISE